MPGTIGKRLATVRAMTDLSASTLGELAGLSRAIVSMMEAGDRKNPNVNTITAIAKVLGISIAWLIDGSGEKPDRDVVRHAVAVALLGQNVSRRRRRAA